MPSTGFTVRVYFKGLPLCKLTVGLWMCVHVCVSHKRIQLVSLVLYTQIPHPKKTAVSRTWGELFRMYQKFERKLIGTLGKIKSPMKDMKRN